MNDVTLKEWQNCHERLWLSIAEHILEHGKTTCIVGLKIKILEDLDMIDLVEPITYCFLCSHVTNCESCWLKKIDYSCTDIYNEFNSFNQRQQVIAAIRIATAIIATEHNYTLSQCYARAFYKIKLNFMSDYRIYAKALSFERLLAEYGLIKFEDDLSLLFKKGL